jgi:hypothetical protein
VLVSRVLGYLQVSLEAIEEERENKEEGEREGERETVGGERDGERVARVDQSASMIQNSILSLSLSLVVLWIDCKADSVRE